MASFSRRLDTVLLEAGRWDFVRGLGKKKPKSEPTETPSKKGLLGPQSRREFLKKTGKAAASSMIPLQKLGLSSTTAKAVIDTLSGVKKSGPPIYMQYSVSTEFKYKQTLSDLLGRLGNAWKDISRYVSGDISSASAGNASVSMTGVISPKLVAELLKRAAESSTTSLHGGKEIEIGGVKYSLIDYFTNNSKDQEVRYCYDRIERIKKNPHSERHFYPTDEDCAKAIIDLDKKAQAIKNSSYNISLRPGGRTTPDHSINIFDGPSNHQSFPTDIASSGRTFKDVVLGWWGKGNRLLSRTVGVQKPYAQYIRQDLIIDKSSAEYMEKIGAPPGRIKSWDEPTNTEFDSELDDEEDYYDDLKDDVEDYEEEPEEEPEEEEQPEEEEPEPEQPEKKHRERARSMETMRGYAGKGLEYPYDESKFQRRLDAVLNEHII